MGRELLVRAGRDRMAPVVMTALCSGIALVPLMLAGYSSGRELLWPVATVIVGGLVTSTILDFVFTPALFWLTAKDAAGRRAAELGPIGAVQACAATQAPGPARQEDGLPPAAGTGKGF